MSIRGRRFLDDWIAGHLAIASSGDPIAASDLADEMMKAASVTGISPDEINEEVGSVFEVIFEALRNQGDPS